MFKFGANLHLHANFFICIYHRGKESKRGKVSNSMYYIRHYRYRTLYEYVTLIKQTQNICTILDQRRIHMADVVLYCRI